MTVAPALTERRVPRRLRAGRARATRSLAVAAVVLVALGLAVAAREETVLEPQPAATLVGAGGRIRILDSLRGHAILTAHNLRPGSTATGTVTIRTTGRARVFLTKSKLRNKLGRYGGALSARLVLSVDDVRRSARPRRLYTGALGAMPQLALGTFARGAPHRYRFRVTLPRGPMPPNNWSGDNRFQGASTSVDYVWTARKAPAPPRPRPRLGGSGKPVSAE
jgi:hypothetical protein